MSMENMNDWLRFVSDSGVLSILFYLRKYNPSVRIRDMEENLRIGEEKIREIISKLSEEQMVQVRNNEFIQLTSRGKVAAERLMAIA